MAAPVTRRRILALLAVAGVLGPRASWAQNAAQSQGVKRVGWLSDLSSPDPGLGLLREGLRELGYEESRHYRIVARYANNDFTKLPGLVEELAGERIDVLVSRGPSVDFTKKIRAQVPVVFAYSGDPVAAG